MEEILDLPAKSTKTVEQAVDHTIQAIPANEYSGRGGLLSYMAQSGQLISPWWSRQRDIDLDRFWKQSDHLSGAKAALTAKVASVPVRVLPRDTSMKAHWKQAEQYSIRLVEESEFGQSWIESVSKFLEDYWLSDNGGFFEIIGGGKPDGPIEGPAMGVSHLDSLRITRTGNAEFPVIYTDVDGTRYKLHRTRVAFASDSPSGRAEMYAVGMCAGSRCVNTAQNLIDIGIYKQEKLGSRPLRAVLVGRGIKTEAIVDSLSIAREIMDNQALARFSKMPVIGDLSPQATLDIVNFASLPDGFDEDSSTKLGMSAIALAFGVPIRWIWPNASTGATKADAEFQHIAGLGGGIGKALATLTMMLGGDPRGPSHMAGKFLPPHLKLIFDFQDDEQDRTKAQIRTIRAQSRNDNIESGVYNLRIAREHALEDGDLSRSQFASIELEDGRLSDGSDVLSLFNSTEPDFMRMLDMGVDEPLAIDLNDPLDMLIEIEAAALSAMEDQGAARSISTRDKATQALQALNALKELYMPLAIQVPEVAEAIESQSTPMTSGAQPIGMGVSEPVDGQGGQPVQPSVQPIEQTPVESQLETATKEFSDLLMTSYGIKQDGRTGFNWGARVGDIIGGQLARGAGGKFVNASDMQLQILRGLISRLRSRRGASGRTTAAGRRASNRTLVAGKVGLSPEMVQDLADLRSGEGEVNADALVSKGLAQRNPDGSVTMTSSGRSLLAAANAGDVDRAKTALLNAGKTPKGKKPSAAQRKKNDDRKKAIDAVSKVLDTTESFIRFSDGGELSDADARRLSHNGLVEFDSQGQPRMTTEGNALSRAINRGDVRGAVDALNKARDRVTEFREIADEFREKADELRIKQVEIQRRLTAWQLQLADLSADPENNQKAIADLRLKIQIDQEIAQSTADAQRRASDVANELDDLYGVSF